MVYLFSIILSVRKSVYLIDCASSVCIIACNYVVYIHLLIDHTNILITLL